MAMFPAIRQMVVMLFLWSLSLLVLTQAAREKDDFRVFDRDFKPTHLQMHHMLRKADLEDKGYIKEATTRIVTTDDTSTQIVTEYFYYKSVPCTSIASVQQELSSLFPGVWKDDVAKRVRKIVINKSLDNSNQCTAGIEVHFPKPNCGRKAASNTAASVANNSKVKRGNNGCSLWCIICFKATSEY